MIGLTATSGRVAGVARLAARSYSASAVARKPLAKTTASELHPLPASVKDAGKPSAPSGQAKFSASGNSLSAADLSSRPAGPGPSAPQTNASRAAPGVTSHSQSEQSGAGEGGLEEYGAELSSDWGKSFRGMSATPFPKEVADILLAPINEEDVEIKPDGIIFLPEIKYRRILSMAFGPGGWGLVPRSETNVTGKLVSREWALICLGQFVSTARGEMDFFGENGMVTATEGAKSNALMRCCKDLGIAHELWSPRFIRKFKQEHCKEVFVEQTGKSGKKKMWRRKDQPPFAYPYKEV